MINEDIAENFKPINYGGGPVLYVTVNGLARYFRSSSFKDLVLCGWDTDRYYYDLNGKMIGDIDNDNSIDQTKYSLLSPDESYKMIAAIP